MRKFLKECASKAPESYEKIGQEDVEQYLKAEEKGCFSFPSPNEAKRRLEEVGVDMLALLERIQPDSSLENLESLKLLRRVFSEQFHVSEKDEVTKGISAKEPAEIPCDNVRNPADPDSSYNRYHGQGYLVQVMESYSESEADKAGSLDLITHVRVHKMTVGDSSAVEPAIEDTESRQVAPQILLGDTRYGSEANEEKLSEKVKLITPTQPPKGYKNDKLTLEQFELDEVGRVLRCPNGQSPLGVSVGQNALHARFDEKLCERCPCLVRCPVVAPMRRGEGSRLQYTRKRVNNRTKRLAERGEAFKRVYRWRAGIEATMCRLKWQMGLANVRVRRIEKGV